MYLFTLRRIPSGVATVNLLSLIRTGDLAETFTHCILSRLGAGTEGPRLGPSCGYIVKR